MTGIKPNPLYSLIIVACLTLLFIPAKAQQINRTVKETLLSKTTLHEMLNSAYTISRNNRSIGFLIRKEDKKIVVIDSLKSKPYDDANTPVFSSDGKRFVYTAKQGTKWIIIVDNQPVKTLDSGTTVPFICFSPDSKQLLYIINEKNKYSIVFNGTNSKIYDYINENSIAFNNTGTKIAFIAGLNGKQFIVYDQIQGLPYDMVGMPHLDTKSQKLAYFGVSGNKSFLIINKWKSEPFDAIGSIKYSNDGSHILYDVQKNGKHYVIVDSTKNEMHEFLHSYVQSEDGTKIAYGIKETPKKEDDFTEYAVINGKKEGPYEQIMIRSFQFSPDGNEVVYGVQLPGDLTDEEALLNPEAAYEWFVVRNGIPQTHYNMLQGSMVFSPNSKRFAYAGERYVKRVVNADGVEEAPYDDIYFITFSPDSKYLAYTARLHNKELVVIEGKNGKEYDELLGNKEIIFDTPDSFHYIALKNDHIYLIEEKID